MSARAHYGYVPLPPTILIMKRMKMIARKPAAETAAFVKAPEIDAAIVRAANATPRTRRTIAARGELSLDVTDPITFTLLLNAVIVFGELFDYIVVLEQYT